MSFRLRALGLLLCVAVAASAATAWLTWRQTTGAVEESVTAGLAEEIRITAGLRQYGATRGTWEGVATAVHALARDTGQRIRVTTGDDVLLADSDALDGREPRPAGDRTPVLVDPLPDFRPPAGTGRVHRMETTVREIREYLAGMRYAACLTRAGADPMVSFTPSGTPSVRTEPSRPQCPRPEPPEARPSVTEAAQACMGRDTAGMDPCLQQVFRDSVRGAVPPRLEVRLGVGDEPPPAPGAQQAAGVAAGVALAVLAAALLLSRAVLGPVLALTEATRSLGEGDLGRRVPATGRDEIAGLARDFNRMAASLQRSEERQRRMTGDIAHELRTPLANLRGYVEALQDGYVEPTPELLDSLHEEVMLQQRIVDDLQQLALAEAGALTYHRTETDLGELLETCRTAQLARAEPTGVTLALEPADHGPPVLVHADPDRLRQAVGNLVGNAIRATPPGGTVTLALEAHGPHALILVRDTGHGIPADDLPHLFDRFWRADAARGRLTGGSGLGLSIVRQIVHDHGGTVRVESAVGTGTTFTVVLDRL
ncbi:sensor histidine kinase [Streptomyces qinzhouensis]|uniref:histidine kinase n=1 Tax=Streptomyces qinzhouensis TaxID=2599401 RepID=A0A5B8IH58_9ACTN|nr:ATP-binding protein [Streptomyces qinzhouensis]QDY77948.1 HAMP domain-containing protein [Streptomyces qinzhouensis]